MKESYIIFWEQNDTPAYRGEEVKWGWRGGRGLLGLQIVIFTFFFFFKVFAEMSFMLTLWCNNTSKKLFFVACKPERIQGHHPAKGWPRPFVLWRSENITCLCSPSLWYGHVLEAFKAVSVSGHKGPPTSVKSRDVINPAMAKEAFQLFEISVPIGSRKNNTQNFKRISLS